jgi:hypothetical protein
MVIALYLLGSKRFKSKSIFYGKQTLSLHEWANSRTIAKLSEFRGGARHWQGSCIKAIMISGE